MKNPVFKNVESGQIIEIIKSPFSIGRSLTCDYVIENKIVSRTHCSLTKTEKGWTLTDSSTNGTLVNDGHYKGIASPVLKHNDEISLGFQSYTYKFLIEVDKVPNCQVQRLKSQESSGNTTASNEIPKSCPGTPNSFDENGISDELLNNLADSMLNSVEQEQPQAPTSIHLNSVENVSGTSQLNQENVSNLKPEESTTLTLMRLAGLQFDQPRESSAPLHQSEQGADSYQLLVNLPELSKSKYLYMPSESHRTFFNQSDDIERITKVASNTGNRNTKLDQQKDANLQSESDSSISTVIYSLPDELTSETLQPDSDTVEVQVSRVNVEQDNDNQTAQVNPGSINASKMSNVISKSRDFPVESIEAVVQRYSEEISNSTTMNASTSNQGTGMASNTLNIGPCTSTVSVSPTSICMTSILNENKKVKVMTVSHGMVSLPRSVSGQVLTPYTLPAGQQAPIIGKLTSGVNSEAQNVTSACTSRISGRPMTLHESINRNRKHNLPTTAIDQYVQLAPVVSTTAGSSVVMVTKNNLLPRDEDQAVVKTYDIGEITNSNMAVLDSTEVPAAGHEVVIENTVETIGNVEINADGRNINQIIPTIKCHDSQEPGTSKTTEKLMTVNSKQNNQNHYEEMENELMCTICANLFIKAVTLGCSHSFCQYCIEQWKKKKTDCPICRNKMTSTIRTLVLDNIIEKMLENASEEDKEDRKAAEDERKKLEEAEAAKKNKNNTKTNSDRGGRRGRGNANTRYNTRINNQTENNDPVITIADSPSTTDSDSDNSDYDNYDYISDQWYGRAYYGGYGRCYNCGGPDHWANSCPYR